MHLDRADKLGQRNLLKSLMDEFADRFGQCLAVGASCEGLPIDLHRHHPVSLMLLGGDQEREVDD